MSDHDLLLRAGGVAEYAVGAAEGERDAVLSWNFGLAPLPSESQSVPAAPSLYGTVPNIAGRWDGRTTVNHNRAVRQVLGRDLTAQYQRAGTCGGRAGSRGLDILQCIQIAAGKAAKFRPASHAWLYFLARREWNMLGKGDGVASGSIPDAMAKYGALQREECGDTDQDSPQTDRLAQLWGAGRIDRADLERYLGLANDNLVTARLRVNSAQELADGLAAGGVGVISDAQGYTMTRDSEGVCHPSGTWYHYHTREGVLVLPSGRRVFAYGQSWGKNTPKGPPLPDFPDNCFGVDWEVQDHCCRTGKCDILFAFDLWDIEKDKLRLDWIF